MSAPSKSNPAAAEQALSNSAVWKSKFIDFVEEQCSERLAAMRVKENPYFDQA